MLIAFEVYTVIVVWRVFVYICDYNMNVELHNRRRITAMSYYWAKDEKPVRRKDAILQQEPMFISLHTSKAMHIRIPIDEISNASDEEEEE